MANIREIAKLAGVSVSTVSRVLNQHPYVSQEKRIAVQKAIEDENYRRNMMAVHLSKGKSNLIGIVLPTINHPYFSSLLEGIAQQALKFNFQLTLFQTEYHREKEIHALEQLKGNVIDGIIFCSRTIELSLLKEYMHFGGIVLCEDAEQEFFPTVSISHTEAFEQGFDYLLSKGHRKIALCLGRLEGTNSLIRQEVYRTKMESIGLKVRKDWVFDQCLTIHDGVETIKKYVHLNEKPSAFLVTNDQVTAGMVSEARANYIRIPEDLALLSFDNQPISEIMDISSIEIPTKKVGMEAMIALNNKLEDHHYHQKTLLSFRLFERKTV